MGAGTAFVLCKEIGKFFTYIRQICIFMCGINGIAGIQDTYRLNDRLVHMNNAIAHRGPDDRGIFAVAGCGLGHVRLSIIDLSKEGHQPMVSASGRFTIVFNGEIYNYELLRKEIGSYPYNSRTDTEVILAGLEKWGTDVFRKLHGMFAIAVWDAKTSRLVLARDQTGKKPLYYTRQEGGPFVFSSELRGLLASGWCNRKLDVRALAEFFAYQTVHAPNTILSGVRELMPGQMLEYANGVESLSNFYSLHDARYTYKITGPYHKVQADIKKLLTQAVEKRMVSDVPLGAFLSGGIDSSIVTALASRFRPGELQTFNISFEEEAYSEAPIARLVARRYNTRHHEIVIPTKGLEQQVVNALDAFDFPSADGVNTYVVSGAAKQAGITVALSGLGGDELFGGYWMFPLAQRIRKLQFLGSVPSGLRSPVSAAVKRLRPGTRTDKIHSIFSQENLDFGSWYPHMRRISDSERLKSIIQAEPYPTAAQAIAVIQNEGRAVTEVSLAELTTYLPNILLRDSDQMAMAHALEIRCPFLDLPLLEYVLSLPDAFKPLRPGKKLLLDTFADLLPVEVYKRKKMGFTFPWEVWLRGPLQGFAEVNIETLASLSVMHGDNIRALWHRFLRGDRSLSWARVWVFVAMGHYIRKHKLTV
jgi:asparagine synthase (glutamine-hydrolysing)